MVTTAEIERVRRDARQVYSAAEVEAALTAMAERITADLASSHPLVVAVMHGGVFAAVHLCERFGFPYEFDYLHVGRYGRGVEGGDLTWIVRPTRAFKDRVVLLVDDVLDRGITLAALHAELRGIGVAELRTAVLVSKEIDDPDSRPPVDYVGLRAGPGYLFGCGMDYKGYWRHMPGLFAVPA